MKKEINVFDYATEIMKAVQAGVLLTTKTEEKFNSMTISWGTLGIEWGKPIFTAFIRENRFTRKQLDESGEFTINMPLGEFDKNILSLCGSKSGKDVDKIKELGLTLEEPSLISTPGIKELPLTLECKIIYHQKQDKDAITDENNSRFYPQDVPVPSTVLIRTIM